MRDHEGSLDLGEAFANLSLFGTYYVKSSGIAQGISVAEIDSRRTLVGLMQSPTKLDALIPFVAFCEDNFGFHVRKSLLEFSSQTNSPLIFNCAYNASRPEKPFVDKNLFANSSQIFPFIELHSISVQGQNYFTYDFSRS